MKITYLGHSGFLAEWENIYCLFDYYTGSLPDLDPDKSFYIFVSHAHGDHYNRDIWALRKSPRPVYYIVSKDIPLSAGQKLKLGLREEDETQITRAGAGREYDLPGGVWVKTLDSTDEGVAFIVRHGEKTIFHAGDLNLWLWAEESAANNKNMERRFLAEMEKLQNITFDAAFFPLDPRQEEDCGKGFEIFNRTAIIKTLFPMHFWNKYDTIQHYIAAHPDESKNIAMIRHTGQEFSI